MSAAKKREAAPEPVPESQPLLLEFEQRVEKRASPNGAEWRAIFTYRSGDTVVQRAMEWRLRPRFFAEYMVHKRDFEAALMEGAGRPR